MSTADEQQRRLSTSIRSLGNLLGETIIEQEGVDLFDDDPLCRLVHRESVDAPCDRDLPVRHFTFVGDEDLGFVVGVAPEHFLRALFVNVAADPHAPKGLAAIPSNATLALVFRELSHRTSERATFVVDSHSGDSLARVLVESTRSRKGRGEL